MQRWIGASAGESTLQLNAKARAFERESVYREPESRWFACGKAAEPCPSRPEMWQRLRCAFRSTLIVRPPRLSFTSSVYCYGVLYWSLLCPDTLANCPRRPRGGALSPSCTLGLLQISLTGQLTNKLAPHVSLGALDFD